METLFLYLLKASGLIAVFFAAYYFLLRKETFFKSNRWFLLFGLVASVVLPLVTFKKTIWVDPVPPTPISFINLQPVAAMQQPETFEINWFWVMGFIYAIGIVVFLFKFCFDFTNLIRVLKGKTIIQQADFKFIDVNEKVSPFSYFNYIVYNSSMYSPSELENILEHEKVHCEQKHSADVLFSRIFCIVFWYNPFVWLYQKAILQNLEFIADSEALRNISDKKAYQITLLKVTTHENCVAITNHFYQSLIKKRIIMLNKNQSKKWNSWKYALIVPVIAAFLIYFQVKVIAQEKNSPDIISAFLTKGTENIVITKNTTDAEMKQHSEMMKQKYGVKLNFSKVKRNGAGEITAIRAEYKDKNSQKGAYAISGDEPIKPINILRKDNGSITFGTAGSKQIHLFSKNNGDAVAAVDPEAPEPPEPPQVPEVPEAPEAPGVTSSYSYSFSDLDDLEELSDLDEMKKELIIETTKDKNGKMTLNINGKTINIDTDKILADVDIERIINQVKAQATAARTRADIARSRGEYARNRAEKAKIDSENVKEEMEQARQEMENSRRELEEVRKQLEESRKEFQRQKAENKKSKNRK